MSLTGANLLIGLSEFIGDYHASSTTGAGSTTTLVDTGLRTIYPGDDTIRGFYLRITETGHTAIFEVRRITSYSAATGTCTVAPAFSATTGSAKAYELHRYNPTKKFTALDEARLAAYPELCEVVFDETTTGDGFSRSFAIPTVMRDGPLFVMEEQPASAEPNWNLDGDTLGDDTTKWTASSATLSTVTRDESDPLIPKYDDSAVKIVVAASTAATVTQAVSSMNSVAAAEPAGRTVSAARWVYCRLASKMRLQLIDDTTTTSGSYHQGRGWELLTVSKDVIGSNATTFSLRLDIASTASPLTAYISRGWLYYGDVERVLDTFDYTMMNIVRRDDTTKRIYLERPIKRGRQVRMVGRDTLSALGRTASTQVTNTMEVDEQSAQLLYAIAGQILFEREGFQATDPDTQNRIATVLGRRAEFTSKFSIEMPTATRLRGMWQ